MKFPTRTKSNKVGVIGETFFQYFVNDKLACIYHPILQENDFGIDGYIELVENDKVTGKLIGVQLKHGDSFFKSTTKIGYKFYGENKHINYYLNSNTPVFIVIMDDKFENLLWTNFDISLTSPSGENKWWIEIKKSNRIDGNFKKVIFESVTPITDFEDEVKWNWSLDNFLSDADRIMLAIPKEDIQCLKFDNVKLFLNRLSKNHEVLINSRSSIDIFFPEYDYDEREIFQIPEINHWLYESVQYGIPWFYFLIYTNKCIGLKLILNSFCSRYETELVEARIKITYKNEDVKQFWVSNFEELNIFTDDNNIDISINKEISDGIIDYFNAEFIEP